MRSCLSLLMLLVFGLTGCAASLQGNEAADPSLALPAHYDTATEAELAGANADAAWRQLFESPHLRALLDTALAHNRELSVALQEIILANTEISARQGELLPTLNAGLGAGVEKVGESSSQGRSDAAHGLPQNLGDVRFGLSGSWEIDVWKRLRNAKGAAKQRALASLEARNFLITQVVAEITRSYFELLAQDNELRVLHANLELQEQALELVTLEKQAARVTELAVQRFSAELLRNQGRVFELEQARTQTENRINFLVGRFPQPITRNPQELLSPLPSALQAGLPSQLLEQRPDVRRAMHLLEAAKLDTRAAKAAFYPSLSLDAELGYRAFNPAHLLDTPASLAYGLGAGLSAPLLNRANITARYRSANAQQIQAVLQYEQIVLQAFGEVMTQLSGVQNLAKRHERQAAQVATLERSVEISNVLFQSARADYVEVLLTRRESLEAQLELLETKQRQFQAMVGVYQALGGGWGPPSSAPAPTSGG